MAGFKVKEARFREEMEKLKRANHGRDGTLKLENIPRDRPGLLATAIKVIAKIKKKKKERKENERKEKVESDIWCEL
jgi:hypothetical protein